MMATFSQAQAIVATAATPLRKCMQLTKRLRVPVGFAFDDRCFLAASPPG